MARQKTKDRDLPARCYRKHNAIYFVNLENKWIRLGGTVAEAMRAYAEMFADDAPASSGPTTLGALLDRYAVEILTQKAKTTQDSNRKELRWLLATFRDVHIDDLKPSDAANYIRLRRGKTRAAREVALLSHALSWAVELGWAQNNVLLGASRKITTTTTSAARRALDAREVDKLSRTITVEDYVRFCLVANEIVSCALCLSLTTGLRRSDVLRLRWADIDARGMYAYVHKSSHYNSPRPVRRVYFPMTAALTDVLATARAARARVQSEYVICNEEGKAYVESGFNAMWQRAQRQFMRAWSVSRFEFHDARRTVGSFVTQTTGLEQAQAQLAHTNARTTVRYTRDAVHLRAVSNILDALRNIRHHK